MGTVPSVTTVEVNRRDISAHEDKPSQDVSRENNMMHKARPWSDLIILGQNNLLCRNHNNDCHIQLGHKCNFNQVDQEEGALIMMHAFVERQFARAVNG